MPLGGGEESVVVEWLARWRGAAGSLRTGEYRLQASLTPGVILERLTAGRVVTYEVAIPEGFTAVQVAARLEEAGLADSQAFARAVEDAELASELGLPAKRLEGYLYPETYRMPRNLSARDISRTMVEHFDIVWRELEGLFGKFSITLSVYPTGIYFIVRCRFGDIKSL